MYQLSFECLLNKPRTCITTCEQNKSGKTAGNCKQTQTKGTFVVIEL